jgi:cold shock CspA family protein
MSTTSEISTERVLTGKVKWFNNKSGFGFITVCEEGELSGKDIFVHYTSIVVKNMQYKYLVQGEYVEFSLENLDGSEHKFHATKVHGVKGGELMCETRKQTIEERNTRSTKGVREATRTEVIEEVRRKSSRRPAPVRHAADVPVATKSEPVAVSDGGFKKVVKKRSAKYLKEVVAASSV